jgi:hypothetical protein
MQKGRQRTLFVAAMKKHPPRENDAQKRTNLRDKE